MSKKHKKQRQLAAEQRRDFVRRATRLPTETVEQSLVRWEAEIQATHVIRARLRRDVHPPIGDMGLFLSVDEAAYYTHFTRQRLLIKEKEGTFPRRRRREGFRGVVYTTSSVLGWMVDIANQRPGVVLPAWLTDERIDPVARLEGMRFIRWKDDAENDIEFCRYHARRLQKRGLIPAQVQTGPNSVAFVLFEVERFMLSYLATDPVDSE